MNPTRTAHATLSILALALFLSPLEIAAQPAQAEVRELTMSVGEQTTIPARGVRSYSEGTPSIVDVRLPRDGTQFVLVALRAGTTSLLLIMEDRRLIRYQIIVGAPTTQEQATVRGAGQEEDDGSVVQRENIRLDFFFVELSERRGYQVGMGWPGTVGGPRIFQASGRYDFLTDGFTSASVTVADQVLPRLDIAQQGGWARVLRHAVLVTANRTAAEFGSGGEFNLTVQGALTAEIRSIEFGSRLRVTPRYDAESGRIEVQLAAQVSDLTDSGSSGVPGRTKTDLETLVNLELGQSIVLAGIVGSGQGRTRSGLPILSQLPVFGILFGSEQWRDEGTESLLFVVPTVIEPMPRQRRDQIQECLRLYTDYTGGLDEVELIETSPPGYR